MERKEGKIPCNCRVDVDYTRKKPEIKFGYTSKNPKKDALKQNMNGVPGLITCLILIFVGALILLPFQETKEYPNNCSVEFSEVELNFTVSTVDHINDSNNREINIDKNYIYGFNMTCDNETSVYKYSRERFELINLEPGFYKESEWSIGRRVSLKLLAIGLFFLAWFLLNRSLTKFLIKQNWYKKWIPKHSAGGRRRKKRYYKFKPKDVEENTIIIPQFMNVELDYKTEGDFSKYLKKIKIREERYHKYRNKKIGKLKIENYKWYVVFYFSKKPESGYLEVIYQ